MMRQVFYSGLLLFCILSTASAATYVVSPNGSDANPGTSGRPFQTINRAAQIAGPGDRVLVKAGTYRESVVLHNSGTESAPISFIADPAGSVVLTGADVIGGWQRVSGSAPIYQAPWDHSFLFTTVTGESVTYHPDDAPLYGRAEQVIVDGRQLLPTPDLQSLQSAWDRHAATGGGSTVPSPLPHLGGPFAGYFMADPDHKLLYICLADGSDPNRHHTEASTRMRIFGDDPSLGRRGIRNVHVSGFVFRYAASFPQYPAVAIDGQDNLLENCVVDQMAGSGVILDGAMRGCLISGCGHCGGSAWGKGYVDERCIWEGNSWKPINREWEAGGLKSVLNNGGTFRHCAFIRNGGPGLWFDINEQNVLVTDCVFEDNEGSGIFIEISKGIRVIHNLFVGNASGAVGDAKPGWGDAGITIAESEDCLVEGNTCVGNKDGIVFREIGPRADIQAARDSADTVTYHCIGDTVCNNISAFNKGYALGLWYDNPFFGRHPHDMGTYATDEDLIKSLPPDRVLDPTQQHITIDNNLYFSDAGKIPFLYGAEWRPRHRQFSDLASFTASTGFDPDSRFGDPLFVNMGKQDFRLEPNSPAKAMGAGWSDAPADINTWIGALRMKPHSDTT